MPIPAFNEMHDKTKHEWADHIIDNMLCVDPHYGEEGRFLRQYIKWLRKSSTKQMELFNAEK